MEAAMLKTSMILTAALSLAATGTAFAQVEVKKNNDNVTKVDGRIGDADVRGMTNPAQTRVRVRSDTLGRADVRIKPGDSTAPIDPQNVEIEVRELNDNVTKAEATSEDLRVRGITNPAQTMVKGRASDGSKVDVRIKEPKN
jgi:multidrug resistance efflux pump